MYNNPYFNPQMNIDNIDRRIEDLQRMKEQYSKPIQPITQNFQIANPVNTDFEARFIKNESVEDIFITKKTAFISLENKFLKIKDLNGNITSYELILPKDEKDLKIEELERRIKEMEAQYEHSNAVKTTSKKQKPDRNDEE